MTLAGLRLDRGELVLIVRMEPSAESLRMMTRALVELGVGVLDVTSSPSVRALARDLGVRGDRGRGVGGAELALACRRVLTNNGSAMHYRDVLDALAIEGLHPRGKDPAATLLTNLNRDPGCVRVGRGHYAAAEAQ